MDNRLGEATSPYLRQHAGNPVHWQQWTPAALAEATRRDVPILLSIGYAACHWCHVMAHESFEDAEVAAAANEHFVCIKVDREERPDLDAVYMNATVAMTGQGGWPMTCFLTPDGRPFFCGTYYPRAQFLQLLSAVSDTWRERRDEVEQASDQITGELRKMADSYFGLSVSGGAPVSAPLCDNAVAGVLSDEDTARGGFGSAPKFPPSALLEALLRNYERTGSVDVLGCVERAGTAMARGGIYDQLAGGFARYSVDNAWVIPHFEKMLYDNALLLRVYAHWARRTGSALAHRISGQTADFLLCDLAAGDLFISSLDADADGREGSTYVWTPAQLHDVLGDDDGRWAASIFGVTEVGTFEEDASVLRLPEDTDDTIRLARVRAALLTARAARVQPARDDKVVTVWNGLAITALTEASVALGRPDLLEAAQRCATALLESHLVGGRLRRASLGGVVGESAAILEDYGALATGLGALHQLTGDRHWLTAATALIDTALAHFADPDRPGRWFDTADDAEVLMVRPADPVDGATPSGASLIAEAVVTAAHLVDPDHAGRYVAAADAALLAHTSLLARTPRSAGHWLAVAEAAVRGPLQIAVACDPTDSPLLTAARRMAPGGAVVVGGAVDSRPVLAGRDRIGGADAAYICLGTVCGLPVTTVGDLAVALDVPV